MSAAALRILHVVPYYEHAWAYGGIPRLATTMTRTLARRGHAVTVCTTDVRDERSRTAAAREWSHGVDVRIFRNVSNRLAYHLQFFTPIGLRAHLRAVAASFDVAHLHACHHLPGAIAAAALTRASVPYVLSPNGTARPIERRVVAKRAFSATIGRHVLSGAARVLAVTRVEHDQLATLGVASSRITVVPNPLDDERDARPDAARFRSAHGLGDGRLVLFLGKLTPRKGVEDLIQAFSRLRLADAMLVFTVRGNMARHAASFRPRYSPIIAVCEFHGVADSLALNWGVHPFVHAFDHHHPERTIESAIKALVQEGRLRAGNTVVVVSAISAGEQIIEVVEMRTVA